MNNNDMNAYTIRLELLRIAHDDCFKLFNEQIQSLRNKTVTSSITGITEMFPVNETEIATRYPKTEDIIKRAKELYVFICDKHV